MTEEDWLSATDPCLLLIDRVEKVTDRTLRLIVCHCLTTLTPYLTDARSRRAVAACQLYLDGLISKKKLAAIRRGAFEATRAFQEHPVYTPDGVEGELAAAGAYFAAWSALHA